MVVAEPGAPGVERDHERVRALQVQQDPFRAGAAGQQVGQLPVDAIDHAGAQEQVLDVVGLPFQHLGEQVLGHGALAAGEFGHEALRLGVYGQGERSEPQPGRPALGPPMQHGHPGGRQPYARSSEELAGFLFAEPQVGRPDFGQLAGQAQSVQVQRQVAARCQHGVDPRREVRQQTGELAEGFRGVQLVEIFNDQREVIVGGGELSEDPVGHRRCAELRCRC